MLSDYRRLSCVFGRIRRQIGAGVPCLAGEVVEEVVAQYSGDSPQQLDIDVFFVEYAVNVAPVAMELRREPCHRAFLGHRIEDFFYLFAYVHCCC